MLTNINPQAEEPVMWWLSSPLNDTNSTCWLEMITWRTSIQREVQLWQIQASMPITVRHLHVGDWSGSGQRIKSAQIFTMGRQVLRHIRQKSDICIECKYNSGSFLSQAALVEQSLFPSQAAGMIGLTAYLSYLVGDFLGFSGIVSLFCCAVLISHYAMRNISKQQRAATLSLFETLSFLSEGSIFVYVGLDALDPQKWEVRYQVKSAKQSMFYPWNITSKCRSYLQWI